MKNLEIDFRPFFPNVVLIAMMFGVAGMLFSAFAEDFGQSKAAFLYSIGFGMAFLTVAATFAKRQYIDKGNSRDLDLSVVILIGLALAMAACMLRFLDLTVFTDMVFEGVVSGAVGLGTGVLQAFAGDSK